MPSITTRLLHQPYDVDVSIVLRGKLNSKRDLVGVPQQLKKVQRWWDWPGNQCACNAQTAQRMHQLTACHQVMMAATS